MGSKGDLFRILQLVDEGKLEPVLDRTLPLEQAAEAHGCSPSARQFGNVVLDCRERSRAYRMSDASIVDAVRTPIGKHRGALKDVRADDLAAIALQALVRARQASTRRRSTRSSSAAPTRPARTTATWRAWRVLLAGLPHAVPAATVNRLCGSGLEAVMQGARMIAAGRGRASCSPAAWSR